MMTLWVKYPLRYIKSLWQLYHLELRKKCRAYSRYGGNHLEAERAENCPSFQETGSQGRHPFRHRRETGSSQHVPPSDLTTMQRP